MYSSRADSILIENHLPEFDPSIPDVQAKEHSNSTRSSKSSEIIRKPIAGEKESEIVLSRFQTKIGKKFLLENFLPSKQHIPSTIEGKNPNVKSRFIHSQIHSIVQKLTQSSQNTTFQHSLHECKYSRTPRLVYTNFEIRPPAGSTDAA